MYIVQCLFCLFSLNIDKDNVVFVYENKVKRIMKDEHEQ